MSILRALTTGPGAAAVAAGAPHFEDKRRFKMTTMFKGQVRVMTTMFKGQVRVCTAYTHKIYKYIKTV